MDNKREYMREYMRKWRKDNYDNKVFYLKKDKIVFK